MSLGESSAPLFEPHFTHPSLVHSFICVFPSLLFNLTRVHSSLHEVAVSPLAFHGHRVFVARHRDAGPGDSLDQTGDKERGKHYKYYDTEEERQERAIPETVLSPLLASTTTPPSAREGHSNSWVRRITRLVFGYHPPQLLDTTPSSEYFITNSGVSLANLYFMDSASRAISLLQHPSLILHLLFKQLSIHPRALNRQLEAAQLPSR